MNPKSICLNPKLIISNHFDSIVREIDIAIEELIEKDAKYKLSLNRVRDEMIAKVKEEQKEAMELYETNLRDELKNDQTFKGLYQAEDREKYLHSKLFAKSRSDFLDDQQDYV